MIATRCENCCFFRANNTCEFNIPQTLLDNFPMVFSSKNFQNNTIYDFYCPYAKTKEWAAEQKEPIDYDSILESRPTFCFIYFIDDNIDNFIHNLTVIKNSKYNYVYFVERNNVNKSEYIKKIEQNELKNWKFHSILDDEMTPSEIIDMILGNCNSTFELIYIINNKYQILSETVDTVLNTFNLLRYHQVVFLPNDIFSFHNIVIPTTLWNYSSERIGLALTNLDTDTETIKFTLT